MKKIVFFISIGIWGITAYPQNTLNETQKLATLCKVWGFLKYYHPQVAKGKFDWDAELIKKIPQIKSAHSKEEINKIYADWIDGLGKAKKRNIKIDTTGIFVKNYDLSWIDRSVVFNEDVKDRLVFIKENRAKRNLYASNRFGPLNIKHEKVYKDSVFPKEGLRMVSLFRYWNIIEYYFPYKYVIGENWDNVLTDMIPKFQFAKDTIEYHLAMKELTVRINDSHAGFSTTHSRKKYGDLFFPGIIKIIDNKVVVAGLYNDSICKLNDIKIGDVILKINGRNVEDIINERIKYASGSNMAVKMGVLPWFLLMSDNDSIDVTLERNNVISSKKVGNNHYLDFKYDRWNSNKAVCSIKEGNIGYVNMGALKLNRVDSVMRIMLDKKAIIFDMRNYSLGTAAFISQYLNKGYVPFAIMTCQDLSFPGMYKWKDTFYAGGKTFLYNWFPNKYKSKINLNYYKGKVVLLINEETQSQAEFSTMALKTAPNVICIGSQTAGTNGDVIRIMFPGAYSTEFSGSGVYYPDGRETQRIGIVPDIEVKPTIEGIKLGKDEVLERAILYINTGK